MRAHTKEEIIVEVGRFMAQYATMIDSTLQNVQCAVRAVVEASSAVDDALKQKVLDALGEDLDGLIASANYLRGFIGYYACARVETAPVWRAINALGFLSDATDIQWRYMDANDRMRSCQWACDEALAAIDIVTPQPALKGLIP